MATEKQKIARKRNWDKARIVSIAQSANNMAYRTEKHLRWNERQQLSKIADIAKNIIENWKPLAPERKV